MADHTQIEWTDATWQPITGCSVVSPGCTNCYAMRLAGTRLQHHPSRKGLTQESKAGPVWTGEVRFNEEWLDQPLRWRKPKRIFVCAHGDLFHENVPDEWIDRVFAVMALAPQHTFQVLTKRANRMREYCSAPDRAASIWETAANIVDMTKARLRVIEQDGDPLLYALGMHGAAWGGDRPWPLRNVWKGVSVEDQARADERIPELLAIPAAVRFISAEPLLGPVDLSPWLDIMVESVDVPGYPAWTSGLGLPTLDWIIAGGESGPGARGSNRAWYRSLRDQCQAAGVAYFHKQNGEWIDADEWLDICNRTPGIFMLDGRPWEPRRPLKFDDAGKLAEWSGRKDRHEHQSDGSTLLRVGKHAAGRLLDGRTWDEFPA